eukprot:COSAG01_NODE_16_length_40091_cov_15.728646_41_plen_123_part_00
MLIGRLDWLRCTSVSEIEPTHLLRFGAGSFFVVRGEHVGAAAAAATGDDDDGAAAHLAAVRALFVGSDASAAAAAAVPRHWRSMCVSCSRRSRTARVFLYHLRATSTTQTEIPELAEISLRF